MEREQTMERLQLEFNEYQYPVGPEVRRLIKVAKDWDTVRFREFLDNIETHFERNQPFHDYRNALVRFGPDETLDIKSDIVVKKFKMTRKYDHFRFHFLPSKAYRSLEIALALLQNGLNTPRPIAIIEERGKYNRLVSSYFLTEFLQFDCSFFQVLKEFDAELKGKLIAATARKIRLMHDAGIIHNDLHASNILISNIKAEPELYFIDLNRARRKRVLSIKNRAKDLGRLALDQHDQTIFFDHYDSQKNSHLMAEICKAKKRRENWLAFKRFLRRH